MRKTIFSFAFAIMFSMALGSCDNGATSNTTDGDSTEVVDTVDTVATDTVTEDSILIVG